jgi:hypothetical protein
MIGGIRVRKANRGNRSRDVVSEWGFAKRRLCKCARNPGIDHIIQFNATLPNQNG